MNPPGPGAARLLALASTPAASPDVTVSRDAAVALKWGYHPAEVERGDAGLLLDAVPLLSIRGRVASVDDATRLQLAYRSLHLNYGGMTPASRRLALLDAAKPGPGGALRVEIRGIATDFAAVPTGGGGSYEAYEAARGVSISRICLVSPIAGAGPAPFDSHIWLSAADCAAGADLNLHLGQAWRVDAELRSYANGRIGLGSWTPLEAALAYVRLDADGRSSGAHADRRYVKRLRLARIAGGAVSWADAKALAAELSRLERRWPEAAGGMRLTWGDKV